MLLGKFIFFTNKITEIIDFLEEFKEEIEKNKDIKIRKLIDEFKLKYYLFRNIQRFCIPVIGCISSGKSTLLNYILELKKLYKWLKK